MKRVLFSRGFFPLLIWFWLMTGCQTLDKKVTHSLAMSENHLPGQSLTQKIFPGVLIKNSTPRVIFNAVIRERVKKRMFIKTRDTYTLKMAVRVPKAKQLTEAQMVYSLYHYAGGLWLSVKAYKIMHPGTQQEHILDLTSTVQKEVQQELNKIARLL